VLCCALQGIEGCAAAFQRLLGDCLAADPVVLRAAAVRLLARAAGLGGGMGPFVAAPLAEALAACAGAPHEAQRLLELAVPLAYRPALKAALLDTSAPATLGRIIGALGGPPPRRRPRLFAAAPSDVRSGQPSPPTRLARLPAETCASLSCILPSLQAPWWRAPRAARSTPARPPPW
jgi:hypothetical protein